MIDVKSFWQTIGQRAIGATVVTAEDRNGARGFLGLSATHLCASPPIVMVSIDKRTSALTTITDAGHFALNFLAEHQSSIADIFSGKGELKGAARFRAGDWVRLQTGAPILLEGVGAMDCLLEETIERHGVVIALGRVVAQRIEPRYKPLILFAGKYL
jgi:flavin reductase (DIM6/NTAB) family NADH-FMN oxidoreductase RutF